MFVLLRPRAWGAHLLLLLALAVTIAAGIWQWDVWGGHRAQAAQHLSRAAPTPLSKVMGGDSAFPADGAGKPVSLTGRWMPGSTMYVEHSQRHGRPGYLVVTPVLVGRSAMPVVRGWSPTTHAPAVHGSVRVAGWLQSSADSGEADLNPNDDVISSLSIASMLQHVPKDLYSAYVVASRISPDTGALPLVRPLPPGVSGFTGLRNLLYALQWWIFGVLAIYIWVRWCLDELHPERRPDRQGEQDHG